MGIFDYGKTDKTAKIWQVKELRERATSLESRISALERYLKIEYNGIPRYIKKEEK